MNAPAPQKNYQGLKPGDFFCALFGATEVVPFQKGHL